MKKMMRKGLDVSFFRVSLAIVCFVLFFAGVGVVNATEYYIAPGGNNSNTGLSLDDAWATLDYADDYVKNPGDILYLAEGEYYGQQFITHGSGTAGDPITIKSLTGNAENTILDGDSYVNNGKVTFKTNGYHYYNIEGFKILDYYTGVDITNAEGWNISNSIFTHLYRSAIVFEEDAKNCIFYNNTLYDIRWNFVQIGGEIGTYSENIYIKNNEFYNNVDHGFIDLMHGFRYVYIENNYAHDGFSAALVYVHQTTVDGFDDSGYLYITNNTVRNCDGGIRFDDPAHNSVFDGNTIYDLYGSPPLQRSVKILDSTENITCRNNNFYGDAYSTLIYGNTQNSLWESNNVTCESGDIEYEFANGPNTIRNACVSGKDWFRVYSGHEVTVEFTDGRTFSVDGQSEYTTYTISGFHTINIFGESAEDISFSGNSWGLIRQNPINQSYEQISAGLDNDVTFSFYNPTNSKWIPYYTLYSINEDYIVPRHNSYFVYFDNDTSVNCVETSAESITIPINKFYYTYLRGPASHTLFEIQTSLEADGIIVNNLYSWDSTTQSYTDTSSYVVSPSESIIIISSTGGIWDGSV